jgi:neutral trehalase
MKPNALLYILAMLLIISCQPATQNTLSEYDALKKEVLRGWNTWDVTSISTQVLLPQGLAVNLQVHDSLSGRELKLMFTGNQSKGSEKVWVIAHTPDGSYTDYRVQWLDFKLRVQSHSEGEDLYVLVTPEDSVLNPGTIRVNSLMHYNREGSIRREYGELMADLPGGEIRIIPVTAPQKHNAPASLRFSLDGPVAYATRRTDLASIQAMMDKNEAAWLDKKNSYGELAEVYDAVQNVINWTVIYDNAKDRPVTPVARPWAFGWGQNTPGGYVLFCWDNFFASFLHSIESKELAFNEAIVMCDEIDDLGFVPNFTSINNLKSRDRSQPPVGSMMVKEVYKRHPEKWFLEKTFDQLLTWNRWWDENRSVEGYLCWGSNPFDPVLGDKREMVTGNHRAASYESGLDNTPMHDGVPFDSTTQTLAQGDVGLMGLYVGDCDALAFIAAEIGRTREAEELKTRGETYRQKLATMWSEEQGIFLNHRIDLDTPNPRISPTNFYALIAKAATQDQAERMVEEHFYNPEEFWGTYIMPSIARNDTAYTGMDYWRGSIWAPMNFLVYLGFRNYDLPQARKDMALKSRKLLLDEWNRDHFVRENYHAETGTEPGARSNPFYHWGALLGMIDLMENAGY